MAVTIAGERMVAGMEPRNSLHGLNRKVQAI